MFKNFTDLNMILKLHFQLQAVLLMLLNTVRGQPESATNEEAAPKPDSFRRLEKYTDKTIDQIITEALGGINVASNKILAPGENILAELDMYLSQEQFLTLYEPPSSDLILLGLTVNKTRPNLRTRQKRKAVRDVVLRWPKAEIPFQLAKGHFSEKEEYVMKQAMTEWERYTCLKFRLASNADRNVVRFQNGEGCNSPLGMVGGVQMLNLDAAGCRFKGLYLHEIGHAVGLVHEHQLPDRDLYIEILFANVAPHMRVWFNKYTPDHINQHDVPYEYSSVMHYGITAFSYDGHSQTIRTHDRSKEESIGKVYLKELSFSDVKVVNSMYECSASCPDRDKCTEDGYLDQNCNCVCKDGSKNCDLKKEIKTDLEVEHRVTNDETCTNLYDSWKCSIWANQGECERNPRYMKKFCMRACGLCDKDNDQEEKNHFTTWTWQWFGMFANLFPKKWMIGVCKDVYSFEKCYKWKQQGDCVTNEQWMTKNCKMTCNFCGDSQLRVETSCRNRHHDDTKCDQWAREGECILNAKWMKERCQRSCHACSDVIDSGGDADEDKDDDDDDDDDIQCVDKHDAKECQKWATNNECIRNPGWMILNCRKSCDKCDDGRCKNLYDDTQCEIWGEDLECIKNPEWMKKNCALDCGVCEGNKTDTTKSKVTVTVRPDVGVTRRPEVRTTLQPDTATCYNLHNDVECNIWAESDHCEINPTWMLDNCRKSCRMCDGTTKTEVCRDRHPTGCSGWAKHGFCAKNAGFNLIYCKKSCNNCNGCRDQQFLCGIWSKAGHCSTNAEYMLRHCQKSCKTCE